MDEQIELAHKVVDVVDRANKFLCDSAAVLCGQVRIFLCSSPILCKEEEDETFQQIVYVNYKLEDFIYLLDVMNSVFDKVISNKPM